MASVLEIIIRARDEASAVMGKVGGSAAGMVGPMDNASAAGNRMAAAGANVMTAYNRAILPIGAAVLATDRMTSAALEDEASQVRLKQAVIASNLSWDQHAGALEAAAQKGIQLGFADEQVRESLALLIAQTGSAEEAQKRLAIAQDVSRGTGLDLATTSRLLGKVTDESINVFGRYGIRLQEGMGAQEALIEVSRRFAGQSKAFADSNAGDLARTRLEVGELQEEIGAKLVPVLSTSIGLFNKLPAEVQLGIVAFAAFGLIFGPAVAGLVSLTAALFAAIPALIAFGTTLVASTGGLILIIPALVAVGAAAYVFRDEIMDVFNTVKDFLLAHQTEVVIILSLLFGPLPILVALAIKYKDDIAGVFNAVKDFLSGHQQEVAFILMLILGPLALVVGGAIAFHNDLLGIFNAVKNFIAQNQAEIAAILMLFLGPLAVVGVAAYRMRDEISGALGEAEARVGAFVSVASALMGAARQVFVEPFDAARRAVNWLIERIRDLIDLIPSIPSMPDISPGFDVPGVPGFQHGVRAFRGGLAIVGERGPELVHLARGTNVVNATETASIMRQVVATERTTVASSAPSPAPVINVQVRPAPVNVQVLPAPVRLPALPASIVNVQGPALPAPGPHWTAGMAVAMDRGREVVREGVTRGGGEALRYAPVGAVQGERMKERPSNEGGKGPTYVFHEGAFQYRPAFSTASHSEREQFMQWVRENGPWR
jgi:hypothetical protein